MYQSLKVGIMCQVCDDSTPCTLKWLVEKWISIYEQHLILHRYDVDEDSWTVLGNLPTEGQSAAFLFSESEAIIMMHLSNTVTLYDLETQALKPDFDHIPSWQDTVHGEKTSLKNIKKG